ncbi:MAG TPA: phosphoglycerate kinase [Nitrososphaerales archaeon]
MVRTVKMTVSDLPDSYYSGKRIFIRVDFNVPIENGIVGEDYRIRRALNTIEYLSDRKAKVILASHLGRPKGKPDKKYSLKPVANRLSEVVRVPVHFIDDCIGDKVVNAIKRMNDGEVLLLENLRFYEGEESCDERFSSALASLADIYVNDAFGTSHRKHASTYGMGMHFKYKLSGFLVDQELKYLTKIRDAPDRPFTVIVGGAKIKDKLTSLRHLIDRADKVLIGGAVAYTFLASKGVSVGDSMVEQEAMSWTADVLSNQGHKIILPTDHIVAISDADIEGIRLVSGQIPNGLKGFDIGRDTIKRYSREIANDNKTIFWSGPMGLFEKEQFSHGTIDVAKSLALAYHRGATTIIGGGDTVAALRAAEISEREVSHISTGGGASLEYVGGEELPGVEVLTDKNAKLV